MNRSHRKCDILSLIMQMKKISRYIKYLKYLKIIRYIWDDMSINVKANMC